MAKIDLHNYEAFLLDFIEGNLSETEVSELKFFALLHPELNIDLESKYLPTLNKEESVFDFKTNLKKSEDELLLSNKSLMYVEGLMNTQEIFEFEKEISNDVILKKEVLLFTKTRLPVDASITFPYKEDLKKETTIISLFNRRLLAIAASVLLIIGLFVLFINKNEITETDLPFTQKNKLPEIKTPREEKISIINKEKQTEEKQNVSLAEKKSYQKIKHRVLNNKPVLKNDTVISKKEEIQTAGKNPLPKEELAAETRSRDIIENKNGEQETTMRTTLAIEEDENDQAETENTKQTFWKRAVNIARKMNELGIKSLKGEEKPNNNFILAFKDFSVEKN